MRNASHQGKQRGRGRGKGKVQNLVVVVVVVVVTVWVSLGKTGSDWLGLLHVSVRPSDM